MYPSSYFCIIIFLVSVSYLVAVPIFSRPLFSPVLYECPYNNIHLSKSFVLCLCLVVYLYISMTIPFLGLTILFLTPIHSMNDKSFHRRFTSLPIISSLEDQVICDNSSRELSSLRQPRLLFLFAVVFLTGTLCATIGILKPSAATLSCTSC